MYRPQSLEVPNNCGVRFVHAVPQWLNDEQRNRNLQSPRFQEINLINNRTAVRPYIPLINSSNNPVNNVAYRWLPRKINNLDYQINQIIRKNDNRIANRMCQSQSFNEGGFSIETRSTFPSYPICAPVVHTSRLSACTYMSPPSPHWTTIGNIMSVKRSTSMPGSRPNSVSLPCQPPQRNDISHSSMKKKCGPFQCLRHQFRRGLHKDTNLLNDHQNTAHMTSNVSTNETKSSKPMFVKKRVTPIASTDAHNSPSSFTRPKGIRKSISLLFSKSHRSSKSDPSSVNRTPTKDKRQQQQQPPLSAQVHSSLDNNNNNDTPSYPHTVSRRNRSYESMLESSDSAGKLSTETNKCCSYSDVQNSSSLSSIQSASNARTKTSVSVDVILCQRSPSETSLSDSESVSSNENQLSSQTASCHGNINYRTEDNSGWKTVVGNVCRSNSKDSAIANSTLSGDGITNQSKRVSLTSTISRTSDITTTSEEFNDSSYSSFNDLQTNYSQYSYVKPRLISALPTNLRPIKVNCDTQDSSDISPSSDSSTETLRPLSSLYFRRHRSSYSNIATVQSNTIDKDLTQTILRRYHSWPDCHLHSHHSEINSPQLHSKPITKPQTPHESKYPRYPSLKPSLIQQNNLNSSPFLSQYSRLYSLRTSDVKDQRNQYCLPGKIPKTSQALYYINVTSKHDKH